MASSAAGRRWVNANQAAIIRAFREAVNRLQDAPRPDDLSIHELALLHLLSQLETASGQPIFNGISSSNDRSQGPEDMQNEELAPIPVDNITVALLSLVEAMGRATNAPDTPGSEAAKRLRSMREEARHRIAVPMDP